MRPSYAVAAKVMREGVPGTAMEAWPLLTPGEMQAVTLYLRTFYKGPERPRLGRRAPQWKNTHK
jgi:cytochrome c oxidase cbb3-type subunit I/II